MEFQDYLSTGCVGFSTGEFNHGVVFRGINSLEGIFGGFNFLLGRGEYLWEYFSTAEGISCIILNINRN